MRPLQASGSSSSATSASQTSSWQVSAIPVCEGVNNMLCVRRCVVVICFIGAGDPRDP